MRRITPVKSQEALKSDIFCLKRQLSLIVDENQLLKVKIRRLENDLRRKEKYIECFQNDPQKDRDARRFRYDSEAMIHKLQKRNEKLEDMILERDLQNEKRYNDMKTMCLYSHVDCKKANRKGSATNFVRQNSAPRNETSCNNSLNKFNAQNRFDSKRLNRMRSLSSLGSNNCEKVMKNRYCVVSTGDSSSSYRQTEPDSESQKIIKILESERNVDKRAIRTKNAEIFRLCAELREIKSLLKSQENNRVTKSTSTTQLEEKLSIGHARDHSNFIDHNKRNISRVKSSERRSSRKTIQYSEADRKTVIKKLPTVDEQNEEMNIPNETCKTPLDISNQKNTTKLALSRPKTRIEYVFDSEVSSDGEEFCLPSNLRSFLQQAVNTISRGSEGDVTSD